MDMTSGSKVLDPLHEFGIPMVGPSSSHTLGPAILGKLARQALGEPPVQAEITLFNSLAEVWFGHGTKQALVAGLLGHDPTSPAITLANDEYARQHGLKSTWRYKRDRRIHPNTVEITVHGCHKWLDFRGASLGGGRVLVEQCQVYDLDSDGEFPRSM